MCGGQVTGVGQSIGCWHPSRVTPVCRALPPSTVLAVRPAVRGPWAPRGPRPRTSPGGRASPGGSAPPPRAPPAPARAPAAAPPRSAPPGRPASANTKSTLHKQNLRMNLQAFFISRKERENIFPFSRPQINFLTNNHLVSLSRESV